MPVDAAGTNANTVCLGSKIKARNRAGLVIILQLVWDDDKDDIIVRLPLGLAEIVFLIESFYLTAAGAGADHKRKILVPPHSPLPILFCNLTELSNFYFQMFAMTGTIVWIEQHNNVRLGW